MTKDEALKLALETLESSRVFVMSREMIKQPEGADWYDNRITAIKEALAQPAQEPVGSVVRWVDGSLIHGWFGDPPPEGTLLYITPTWVGLTEEEIHASKPPISNDAVVWELAVEWAEAKLRDKNA